MCLVFLVSSGQEGLLVESELCLKRNLFVIDCPNHTGSAKEGQEVKLFPCRFVTSPSFSLNLNRLIAKTTIQKFKKCFVKLPSFSRNRSGFFGRGQLLL